MCCSVCCSSIGVPWFKDRISIFSLKIRSFSAIGCTCLYTCLESMSLYWTYMSEIDCSDLKIRSFSAVSCTCLYACLYVTLLDIHVWNRLFRSQDLFAFVFQVSLATFPWKETEIEIKDWDSMTLQCCRVLQCAAVSVAVQCVAMCRSLRYNQRSRWEMNIKNVD